MVDSRQEKAEELKKLIDSILEHNIADITHNKEWGKINFAKVEASLKNIFLVCKHLKSLPLEIASDSQLLETIHILRQLKSYKTTNNHEKKGIIDQILSYDIEQTNHTTIKTNLITQLDAVDKQLYERTHGYIPFLAYQDRDVQKNIEALTTAKEEAKSILRGVKEDVEVQEKEIKSIVSATKQAAGEAGVAEFAVTFKTQSEEYNKSAVKWLRATMILAGFTFFLTLFFLCPIFKDMPTTQYLSSKIFVMALFFTTTLWCGGIYKTIKHQSSINKFKADALQTFQTFIKAADDPSIKDAVLLETTKAIFNEYKTGYIKEESSSDKMKVLNLGTNITRLVRTTDGTHIS